MAADIEIGKRSLFRTLTLLKWSSNWIDYNGLRDCIGYIGQIFSVVDMFAYFCRRRYLDMILCHHDGSIFLLNPVCTKRWVSDCGLGVQMIFWLYPATT